MLISSIGVADSQDTEKNIQQLFPYSLTPRHSYSLYVILMGMLAALNHCAGARGWGFEWVTETGATAEREKRQLNEGWACKGGGVGRSLFHARDIQYYKNSIMIFPHPPPSQFAFFIFQNNDIMDKTDIFHLCCLTPRAQYYLGFLCN